MKNLVKIGFVAVFTAIAGYGIYVNQKADSISDLMLVNVEALASGETIKDCESGGNGCLSNGRWFPYEREPW